MQPNIQNINEGWISLGSPTNLQLIFGNAEMLTASTPPTSGDRGFKMVRDKIYAVELDAGEQVFVQGTDKTSSVILAN